MFVDKFDANLLDSDTEYWLIKFLLNIDVLMTGESPNVFHRVFYADKCKTCGSI